MNKEYTYIDGKVIISDINNNKIKSEYFDNLDEVLVKENLIETMEKNIEELEKESESYEKNSTKHYIPIVLPIAVLTSTIGTPLITNLLTVSNSFAIATDTIFGPMSEAMAVSISMSICMIPLGAVIEFFMYRKHKNSIKREKGINSELDFLRKQIETEKEFLENLKRDKSKDNENTEFRTVSVDDSQQLKDLENQLDFHYNLGYNEEKGPSLVLKKKKKTSKKC